MFTNKNLLLQESISDTPFKDVKNEDTNIFLYGLECVRENDALLRSTMENMYTNAIINESIAINEKDIYYNKDKFDSGEINLCFITGLSGSGKSTMGQKMQDKGNVEWYQLDDLLAVKDRWLMDHLKEYRNLIYLYFNGIGKKYYVGEEEALKHINSDWDHHYEDIMIPQFVHYAMKYAKAHKDKKIVIEGVWLFCNIKYWGYANANACKPMFKPEEFKDYAFYIKGTSAIVSAIRAAKRDYKDKLKLAERILSPKRWLMYLDDEKNINTFRRYFSNLTKKQDAIDESATTTTTTFVERFNNSFDFADIIDQIFEAYYNTYNNIYDKGYAAASKEAKFIDNVKSHASDIKFIKSIKEKIDIASTRKGVNLGLPMHFDFYRYTNIFEEVPGIDLNAKFIELLEALEDQVYTILKDTEGVDQIEKLKKLYGKVTDHANRYLDSIRGGVLGKYKVYEDEYDTDLFEYFRNGKTESSGSVVKAKYITECYNRYTKADKLLAADSKRHNRFVKNIIDTRERVQNAGKKIIGYSDNEATQYITLNILKANCSIILDMCNIYSLAYAYKWDSIKNALHSDRIILLTAAYDAIHS